MRIGVDARELSDQATGVGRYLQCLLHEWAMSAVPHQWTLYSPDGRLAVPPGLDAEVAIVPGKGNTWWEQAALARAVRRDRPDLFFAPGYTAPLCTGVPLVVTMHDVSFAAHPEWYPLARGTAAPMAVAIGGAKGARVVLTISEFSRGEIVRYLRVPPDRVRAIPHGVGMASANVLAPCRASLWCSSSDRSSIAANCPR